VGKYLCLVGLFCCSNIWAQNFNFITKENVNNPCFGSGVFSDSTVVMGSHNYSNYGINLCFLSKSGSITNTLNLVDKEYYHLPYDLIIDRNDFIWIVGYRYFRKTDDTIQGFILKLDRCTKVLQYNILSVNNFAKNIAGVITGIINLDSIILVSFKYQKLEKNKSNFTNFFELKNDSIYLRGHVDNTLDFNSQIIDSSKYLIAFDNFKSQSNTGQYKAGYIEFDSTGRLVKEYVIDGFDPSKAATSAFVWKNERNTIIGAKDNTIGKKRSAYPIASTIYDIDDASNTINYQYVTTDTNFVEWWEQTAVAWNGKVACVKSRLRNDMQPKSNVVTPTICLLNRDGTIYKTFVPGEGAGKPSYYMVEKLEVTKDNHLLVVGSIHKVNLLGEEYWQSYAALYDTAFQVVLADTSVKYSGCFKSDTIIFLNPTRIFNLNAESIPELPHEIININSGEWSFVLANERLKKIDGNLYPNPSTGAFVITLKANIAAHSYDIYKANGTLLGRNKLDGGQNIITCKIEQSGIFRICVYTTQGVLYKTVIIQ
jgi:hypothetical protein